jgi:dTDP-4-amino-4,6-dideoxygalactose transaminase
LVLPTTAPDVEHVFHLYVVRTPLRDALRDYLAGAGVGTSIYDQKGVQRQKAYAPLGGEEVGPAPTPKRRLARCCRCPSFPNGASTKWNKSLG